MSDIVTRFPPSPSGYLHLGGARTAIFNWLYARHMRGRFVLRFEDTDTERSSQEYVDAILQSLEWLGIDWDEGPYFQTRRFDIYREYIRTLVDSGNAYYCTCPPERLEQMRQTAMAGGGKPKYDGTCRNLGRDLPDRPSVVRFRAPHGGATAFHDLIKGPISFANDELDDLIIQCSDGTPTYNFTVVIDDASMAITHPTGRTWRPSRLNSSCPPGPAIEPAAPSRARTSLPVR